MRERTILERLREVAAFTILATFPALVYDWLRFAHWAHTFTGVLDGWPLLILVVFACVLLNTKSFSVVAGHAPSRILRSSIFAVQILLLLGTITHRLLVH